MNSHPSHPDIQQIIEAKFADLIAQLKEDPRNKATLRTYLDGVLNSGLECTAASIIRPLLSGTTDAATGKYLVEFITAYADEISGRWDAQISQIAQAPVPTLTRLAGHYQTLGEEIKSRRLARLASCFDAIENGGTANLHRDLMEFHRDAEPAGPPESGWVCFVTECNITVRIRKLAVAARAAGKKVALLVRRTEDFPAPDPSEFEKIELLPVHFDPLALWRGIDDVHPQAVHCFVADRHGYMEALGVMASRPDICVIDFYDFSHPDVGPMKRLESGSDQWKEYEYHTRIYRFLMNHMSGHCSRTLYNRLQKSEFEELTGRQSRLAFPELCWGRTPGSEKLSAKDGTLHAVAASTFFVGSEYNDEFSGYPLIDKAEQLGIHLHLYALTFPGTDRDELKAMIESRPNCHFHDPLPYEEWQAEVEKYDVGLFRLYPRDNSQMNNIPLAMDPTRGWSNKFGDFLDGNVYMVFGSDLEYQTFVARRYGIGEGADEDDLLSPDFWQSLKTKLLEEGVDFAVAKDVLRIDGQGDKLARFYDRLSRTNPYPRPG